MNETKSNREALIQTLVTLGRSWARQGLTIGRAALTTSAHTLETTAASLGQLADALAANTEEQKKSDASEASAPEQR